MTAAARRVPSWAISCVVDGRRLVDEAAELDDLVDVYDAQIQVAERDACGVLRDPVYALAGQLEGLASRLTAHVPRLIAARDAFDEPRGAEVGAATAPAEAGSAAEECGAAAEECGAAAELPIAILRSRGRLGEVWHSASSASQFYAEPFKRMLKRRAGTSAACIQDDRDPREYLSTYALAYL